MPRIDRFETECRCGREVVVIAPQADGQETRWVRGECGHITPAETTGPADLAALRGGDA